MHKWIYYIHLCSPAIIYSKSVILHSRKKILWIKIKLKYQAVLENFVVLTNFLNYFCAVFSSHWIGVMKSYPSFPTLLCVLEEGDHAFNGDYRIGENHQKENKWKFSDNLGFPRVESMCLSSSCLDYVRIP